MAYSPPPLPRVPKIDPRTGARIEGGFDPGAGLDPRAPFFEPPPPPADSFGEQLSTWFGQNSTWVIIGIGALVVLMAMKGRR